MKIGLLQSKASDIRPVPHAASLPKGHHTSPATKKVNGS